MSVLTARIYAGDNRIWEVYACRLHRNTAARWNRYTGWCPRKSPISPCRLLQNGVGQCSEWGWNRLYPLARARRSETRTRSCTCRKNGPFPENIREC